MNGKGLLLLIAAGVALAWVASKPAHSPAPVRPDTRPAPPEPAKPQPPRKPRPSP